MAKAKGKAGARGQAMSSLLIVVMLVVMVGVITGWNPLPGLANWLSNLTVTLSTPKTTWTVRAGDEPTAATVLSKAIVVISKGSVEARDPLTGARLWSHDDSWATVAGDSQPVVLVGRPIQTGYDVYDAVSGVRLWSSGQKAGVWAYSNMVLTLQCPQEFSCTLRALDPVNGNALWSLPITGAGRSLVGMGHRLAAVGTISPAYADSFAAIPHAAPPVIGLPMGGEIHVVSTADGQALRIYRPDTSTRVALAGDDVIVSTAALRGNSCYYTEQARDPVTDQVLWSHDGYNLKTSEGLGCDQRDDPVGGGNAIFAIDSTGHDVLLSAQSGHVLFRATVGEHIVATNGRIAVVRTANKQQLRAINLSNGRQIWTHEAGRAALVGVADYVLIADPGAGRLAVLDPTSGLPMLDIATGATVLGIGPSTIIINIGRSFGPLPVTVSPKPAAVSP